MKKLYGRLVLWLVRPALDMRCSERAPTARDFEALSARIETIQASMADNAAAIRAESMARETADATLRSQLYSVKTQM
ncbi:hypothetical protein BPS26883_06135 [Burkholderia pseudomultivorans]|uniref:Uncharacterized protein n=1 Tax=Burkholderia pseudomultivorans TaxID=1207504 RepID=A0A6P2QZZ6_9BURK|nr:hypothetical protein [Burkholderia pseudomultivorans]VWC26070.1 hypothetical protein BPS26883_06135 [Burkholderia pseudomultivorans]